MSLLVDKLVSQTSPGFGHLGWLLTTGKGVSDLIYPQLKIWWKLQFTPTWISLIMNPVLSNYNHKNDSLAPSTFCITSILKNDISTRKVLTVLLFPIINDSVIKSADGLEIKTEMCPRVEFERMLCVMCPSSYVPVWKVLRDIFTAVRE